MMLSSEIRLEKNLGEKNEYLRINPPEARSLSTEPSRSHRSNCATRHRQPVHNLELAVVITPDCSYLISTMARWSFLALFVHLLPLTVSSYGLSLKVVRQHISAIALTGALIIGCSDPSAAAGAKMTNLEPSAMAMIVAADITERQALITADFTREIYSEKCTFQDEIDTYPIDKYVSGTKALFNREKSHVDLVGDVVVTDASADFRFSEVLAFNIPFNPRVTLTGKVKLSRGPDGLITASREYWDQSVPAVLSTVKF